MSAAGILGKHLSLSKSGTKLGGDPLLNMFKLCAHTGFPYQAIYHLVIQSAPLDGKSISVLKWTISTCRGFTLPGRKFLDERKSSCTQKAKIVCEVSKSFELFLCSEEAHAFHRIHPMVGTMGIHKNGPVLYMSESQFAYSSRLICSFMASTETNCACASLGHTKFTASGD